jgi:pimeloyl-ACP methyl ester carboxylesterase
MPVDTTLSHNVAEVGDVRLHYARGGRGEPVLLVHGWPQTWFSWRHVIPRLIEAGHDVIAVDMRGAGDSSRPKTGYDSDTVAADLHALVQHLGISRIRLVGHDNGGRVAYAYAANYRDEVASLVFLESKVLGVESDDDAQKEYWHFGFHQEADLPDLLLAGREREYLSFFYKRYAFDPRAITGEEIDEYVRCYESLGGMRAGFEYYRAFPESARQSCELAKTKLTIPVLAYGGSHCMGEIPLRSMQRVAQHVEGGVIPQCGHWIPDEKPEWLAERIVAFHGTATSKP